MIDADALDEQYDEEEEEEEPIQDSPLDLICSELVTFRLFALGSIARGIAQYRRPRKKPQQVFRVYRCHSCSHCQLRLAE